MAGQLCVRPHVSSAALADFFFLTEAQRTVCLSVCLLFERLSVLGVRTETLVCDWCETPAVLHIQN